MFFLATEFDLHSAVDMLTGFAMGSLTVVAFIAVVWTVKKIAKRTKTFQPKEVVYAQKRGNSCLHKPVS